MKKLSEIVEIFYARYTDLMILKREFLELLVPTPHIWY
jgi:hypothetical protein